MSTISKRMKLPSPLNLELDSLPDEILLEIFKFFDLKTRFRAMLTCRHWYRLCTSPSLKYNLTHLILRQHSHLDQFKNSPYFPVGHNKLWNLKYLLKHFARCDSLQLKSSSRGFVRKLTNIIYAIDEVNGNSTPNDEPIFDTDTILIRNIYLHTLNLDDLPKFVRHFYLHALYYPYMLNRSFARWPDSFAHMRTLCLRGFPIPSNCRFPANLTVLQYNCDFQTDYLRSCLNQLTTCPNLESLEFGSTHFGSTSIRNLIHTIRDYLLKLECLTFNEVSFPDETLREIIRDYSGNGISSTNWFEKLHEASFGPTYGSSDFYSMVAQFLGNFQLKYIFLDAKINDLKHVYRLIPTLLANGTELRMRLGFPTCSTDSNKLSPRTVHQSMSPPDFARTLTQFRAYEISNTELIRGIFRGGCFERLIELEFLRCAGLEDANVVFISKNCPRLEQLSIRNCCNVTSFSIAQFIVNWPSIDSRRIVVDFIDERRDSQMIADPSSKNTTTMAKVASEAGIKFDPGQDRYDFGDGRRASMIDKDLPSGRHAQRLTVWEECSTEGGQSSADGVRYKKMLIVRSYGDEELGLNMEFGIDMH